MTRLALLLARTILPGPKRRRVNPGATDYLDILGRVRADHDIDELIAEYPFSKRMLNAGDQAVVWDRHHMSYFSRLFVGWTHESPRRGAVSGRLTIRVSTICFAIVLLL